MPKRKKRGDNDTPWKKILRQYFPQAIEFFFPLVAEKIDWSKPCEFLDKEFQKIAPDAEQGKRYADKLVKVWLKDGRSTYLLLHVEIQAQKEEEFALRMLIYNIRIFDHFGSFATSLAILCDPNSAWRPQGCVLESPATRLAFEFGQVKLLDYRERWEALEQSKNLFAPVVMAHLKTQETKRSPKQRKEWKFGLMRRLYEQGWSQQEIFYFYEFVDWVMILPEALETQFWQELKQFEETRKMRYITNAERFALREADEQARLEIAQAMLNEGMPLENIAKLTKLSVDRIQQLQASLSQPSES
ncbi:MAG: Rpn family recombination-promoting nuclease/putative transposase [Leptolyngbya sp. Prado105]|jgi:hypothetical protein|nr:Rpn family recombination-promoting nuclease/putative transposase [Leptolyngbya sp. Prado105]